MILETLYVLSMSSGLPLLIGKLFDDAADRAAAKDFKKIKKRDDVEFKKAIKLNQHGNSCFLKTLKANENPSYRLKHSHQTSQRMA